MFTASGVCWKTDNEKSTNIGYSKALSRRLGKGTTAATARSVA
jgi:hypothetical protein